MLQATDGSDRVTSTTIANGTLEITEVVEPEVGDGPSFLGELLGRSSDRLGLQVAVRLMAENKSF